MGQHNPKVDAYIAKSAAFARPILSHLRERIHAECPEAEEAIKWSMPFFVRNGHNLCHMAAFKQHCALGFWNGKQVVGEGAPTGEAMGQFGRIESAADLPSDKQLAALLKTAIKLNDAGVKSPRMVHRKPKPALPVPDDLATGLAKNSKARAVFEAFPPGKRHEYIEWIVEAKAAATRQKRLDQALEWIAEGKARNWKYENC